MASESNEAAVEEVKSGEVGSRVDMKTKSGSRHEETEQQLSLRELRERRNRTILMVISVFNTAVFVGYFSGWGPMQILLEDNGAFSSKCTPEEQSAGIVCTEQTNALLNIQLISLLTVVIAPVLGALIDFFGATKGYFAMVAGTWLGLSLLTVATAKQIDGMLYPAFIIMAISTWIGSLLTVQVGLYFTGEAQSRVIFLLNVSFDAGSMVYLFLWWLGEITGATVSTLTMGFLLASVVVLGTGLYYWTVAVPECTHDKVDDQAPPLTTRQSPLTNEDIESESTSSIIFAEEDTAALRGGDNVAALDHTSDGGVADNKNLTGLGTTGEPFTEVVPPMQQTLDGSEDDEKYECSVSHSLFAGDFPELTPEVSTNRVECEEAAAQERPVDHTAESGDKAITLETETEAINNGFGGENVSEVHHDESESTTQPATEDPPCVMVYDDSESAARQVPGAPRGVRIEDESESTVEQGAEGRNGAKVDDESESRHSTAVRIVPQRGLPSRRQSSQSDYVVIAERTSFKQVTSTAFIGLNLFFMIQSASSTWNLSTQRDFLAFLGDDEVNNLYLSVFTLLMPASILFVPLGDFLLSRFGFIVSLQVVNVMGIGFCLVKVLSSNLNVQVIGFLIFTVYRSFLYGVTFSFMPTFLGGDVVGKAQGLMFLCQGLFFFICIPLANLAFDKYGGNFLVPNIVFLFLNLPCIVAVWVIGRAMKKEEAHKELASQPLNDFHNVGMRNLSLSSDLQRRQHLIDSRLAAVRAF